MATNVEAEEIDIPVLRAGSKKEEDNSQTSESVTQESASVDSDLKPVVVINSKGEYETVMKPASVARVITEDMMRESWDQSNSDRMDTSKYDPMMHRNFVNRQRDDPATIASHELGYQPVRDKRAAMLSGHQFGKVEGWDGEVAHIGDAVLVHCPKAMKEAREAKRKQQREISKREILESSKNDLMASLEPYTRNGKVSISDDTKYTSDLDSVQSAISGSGDRASVMAEAAMLARERHLAEERRARSSSFGGFQGNPEYNRAIKESPFFRDALNKVIGE